ncbi:MAG TPA: hypothetical protein PK447_04735, partial [Ignavibacteria bacterium]|nr:hypothetical protein [Ignavibacteria bacterium]
MKKFIFIIFSVLIIFIHVVDAYSIPKGILTIETNILNTTTFEVSLYLQRTVDSDFWKLGGSSFVFNFNRNALVFNSISDIGNWGVPPYQAPFSSEYTKYPWRTFETLLYTVNGGTEVPLTKTLLAKLQFTITNPLMNHQVFWIGSPYSAVFTDNLETEVTDNLTIVNPVDAPLPVSLSSFNSSVNKNAVNLKWKTA